MSTVFLSPGHIWSLMVSKDSVFIDFPGGKLSLDFGDSFCKHYNTIT